MSETETELLTFDEMRELVERLKTGSAILFFSLQEIFNIHDIDDDENCGECGQHYPCQTAQVLLNHFVVQPDEQEETPAE